MASIQGEVVLDRLARALGISAPVSKIVIEAAADDVVRAYVVAVVPGQVIPAIVEAIKIIPVAGVSVDDDGEIGLIEESERRARAGVALRDLCASFPCRPSCSART